jgi:hypothetical protein
VAELPSGDAGLDETVANLLDVDILEIDRLMAERQRHNLNLHARDVTPSGQLVTIVRLDPPQNVEHLKVFIAPPLHVVAARLGDRPETILRAYAHLLPHSDVEAAEQVAALIAG